MTWKWTVGVILGACGLLGACGGLPDPTPPPPSMDQAQCQAADWTAQGSRDAEAGRGSGRVDDHAKACAPFGIVPDVNAYHAGHVEGRRAWCRPGVGFAMGRRGGRYNPGYCAGDLEPAFMQAVADGREVHDARTFAETLSNRASSARLEADRLVYDLRTQEQALGVEGLTEAQKEAIHARIRSLRIDRDRQLSEASRLQSEADDAGRQADAVATRFVATYGG